MKAKTISGTNVEILSVNGMNIVTVRVSGRTHITQVNANDLIVPENTIIPDELKDLQFHEPVKENPENLENS